MATLPYPKRKHWPRADALSKLVEAGDALVIASGVLVPRAELVKLLREYDHLSGNEPFFDAVAALTAETPIQSTVAKPSLDANATTDH